jgi:ParB family transcriptional regulator, chromosome partitioning protein
VSNSSSRENPAASPQDTSAPTAASVRASASSRRQRGGLGRGLSSLIPTQPDDTAADAGDISGDEPRTLPVDAIVPNPYQPRSHLDRQRLEELAASIRTHGVVQPLIVARQRDAETYTLIAGERRWRAARLAGFERVPVVVKDAVPQTMLELALVENVVRADLSPLEEAVAYRQLVDEFGLTQAQVAGRVGRSRVSVTNAMRLLGAPERVQEALAANQITEGHARALLGLSTAADQITALEQVIDRLLNVRQTEDLVRRWLAGTVRRAGADQPRDPDESRMEERFRGALGTKVAFKRAGQGGGGTLTIQLYSDEQLNALYERLAGEEFW